MLTLADLELAAKETGFRIEPLEKAVRLLGLLEGLRSHPFLKSRLALKGGTALNLFVADLPRLSIDVDLNYIGAADREAMIAHRPGMEKAIAAVCGRLDIEVKRLPKDHAGGKWRLSYDSVYGRSATLELDVNFLLRTPLWPPVTLDSKPLGPYQAAGIPMLDIHELAAGKLVALLSRFAARDLFDARQLLSLPGLDEKKLRLAFVVYGGMSRKDLRDIEVGDIAADAQEIDRRLVPMLRADLAPTRDNLSTWVRQLVEECRQVMATVLPLARHEKRFLDELNDRGDIAPELLSDDAGLQGIIRNHPGLRWKAINVKKHHGIPSVGDEIPSSD